MILTQKVSSVINPTGEPKNDVNLLFDYSRKKYRVTSRLKQMRAPPMLLRKCSYCMKVCGGEGLVFTARWCLEILTKTLCSCIDFGQENRSLDMVETGYKQTFWMSDNSSLDNHSLDDRSQRSFLFYKKKLLARR